MKQYTKGIITGLIIAVAIAAVPTLAANIDALLNPVRININGVDTYQWGEEIALDNGTTTPSSILYNGTTYLPMRKLGELMDKQIYWNGDTQTVSMTEKQSGVKVVAEKPDANGNMWTYYTFKDENEKNYLGVKDKARGFERVYLMSSESVRVTDNEIYFVRDKSYYDHPYSNGVDLVKLSFANTSDNQDGEVIRSIGTVDSGEVIFDGDYVYYAGSIAGGSGHGFLIAYNYITGMRAETGLGTWEYYGDIKLENTADEKAIFSYKIYKSGYVGDGKTTYNKATNEFTRAINNPIQYTNP